MEFEGSWYHLYNRGANKSEIFLDQADYRRFLRLLYLSNSVDSFDYRALSEKSLSEIERKEILVDITSYALMPNHFHILIKEVREGGRKMFLRKLCTAYTMYFNKKYGHSGVVFQGDSKSKLVEDDTYFQYLGVYIHLNPIKLIQPNWKTDTLFDVEKIKQYLQQYKYSSYIDFYGIQREENLLISNNIEDTKKYFITDPKELLNTWIQNRE